MDSEKKCAVLDADFIIKSFISRKDEDHHFIFYNIFLMI